MKETVKILIIFLISFSAHCQEKQITIPTYTNGDTAYYFKYTSMLCKKLKFTDLTQSTTEFYFRLWNPGLATDIWKDKDSNIKGEITNFYEAEGEKIWGKIYSNKIQIDSIDAKKTYEFILKSMIDTLPTEDDIEGWSGGLDGELYIIEFSTPNKYSFKSYWSPTAQGKLKEALIVEKFMQNFNKMLNLLDISFRFYYSIPDDYFQQCLLKERNKQKKKYEKKMNSKK